MKLARLLCLLLALPALAHAVDLSSGSQPVRDFSRELQRASGTRDLDAIYDLYDFTATPQARVDHDMSQWEDLFQYANDHKLTVVEITFSDKAAYLAQADVDQRSAAQLFGPRQRFGSWYRPTLDVVGLVTVEFKSGTSSTSSRFRVGLDAAGALRLVSETQMAKAP